MYKSIVLFLSKIIFYIERVNNLELSIDHRSSLESLNMLLSKSLPHFEFLWTEEGQEKYITLACFAEDYEGKELVPENVLFKIYKIYKIINKFVVENEIYLEHIESNYGESEQFTETQVKKNLFMIGLLLYYNIPDRKDQLRQVYMEFRLL